MIGQDELAEIVRNHDALAEEHQDQPGFWSRKFDVDAKALAHVAEQRALRVVMIRKGLDPNQTKPVGVALDKDDLRDLTQFAAMFLDAFAAGMAAEQRKHSGAGT